MAIHKGWRRRTDPPEAPTTDASADPAPADSTPSDSTGPDPTGSDPGESGTVVTVRTEVPDPDTTVAPPGGQPRPGGRFSVHDLGPVLLLRAAHPRQALLTALGVAIAAAMTGRAGREIALVLLTVLVGQAILGWHNDLVDRARDLAHATPGKPVADGRLDPGNVWFTLTCGVLLVIPLSIASGVTAGSAYLASLAVALMGNVVLRKGLFSWVPWAASYALYPAYLSYGGWGGSFEGHPPTLTFTVLAAMLGVGVHFLRALWGLVADNEDGWTYLPLRVGLRLGAGRLLVLASVYTGLVVVGMAFAGSYVGLAQ